MALMPAVSCHAARTRAGARTIRASDGFRLRFRPRGRRPDHDRATCPNESSPSVHVDGVPRMPVVDRDQRLIVLTWQSASRNHRSGAPGGTWSAGNGPSDLDALFPRPQGRRISRRVRATMVLSCRPSTKTLPQPAAVETGRDTGKARKLEHGRRALSYKRHRIR